MMHLRQLWVLRPPDCSLILFSPRLCMCRLAAESSTLRVTRFKFLIYTAKKQRKSHIDKYTDTNYSTHGRLKNTRKHLK